MGPTTIDPYQKCVISQLAIVYVISSIETIEIEKQQVTKEITEGIYCKLIVTMANNWK